MNPKFFGFTGSSDWIEWMRHYASKVMMRSLLTKAGDVRTCLPKPSTVLCSVFGLMMTAVILPKCRQLINLDMSLYPAVGGEFIREPRMKNSPEASDLPDLPVA